MRKIIPLIILLSLTPLLVYAQESLSELDQRLAEEASKIFEEQEAAKAKAAEEAKGSFSKVDCLPGQIEKAVSGGGIICVGSGEAVSFDDTTGYIILGIIIVVIIIAIGAFAAKGKPEDVERKDFSTAVKEEVLKNQKHRCNSCNRLLNVVDYDHVDGDRSNNDISNCQALCPNCHAEKSRRTQMKS